MSLQRRIERLELEALQRHITSYLPPGVAFDRALDFFIAWLEQPLEARQASMPQFTRDEHLEIGSWLPLHRRLRWYTRKPYAR